MDMPTNRDASHLKIITVTDCYLAHHYLPVRIREGLDVEVRGRPGEEELGQPAAVPPSGPSKY